MNQKVVNSDEYILKYPKWQEELIVLRDILKATELEESIKWGAPVYALNGKNVVGIAAFKNHFALWFFNGIFLKDTKKKLVNAQKEKTKALRQWRFEKIEDMEPKLIKQYIEEAIANQKAGKEIKPNRKKELKVPAELKKALAANKKANNVYGAFSPSKQREYAEYISEAKQEATKQRRLEKVIPMIEKGVGLHDKYKNC